MLQGGGIDPRAQPRETLRQYGRFHATPRDPDELLDLVGLQSVATTRYRRLSGGERQRLGLALALVGRPEVLILDEPTAGMDPEARARTRTIVTDARDAGLAILLTSHDLADVERLADRIVILAAGRVVASGTPGELMASTAQAVTFRLAQVIGAGERRALAAALSAAGRNASVATVGDDGRYRIDGVPPDPGVIAALAAWCAASDRLLLEVRSTGGTLEDAYLALAGSASEDGP